MDAVPLEPRTTESGSASVDLIDNLSAVEMNIDIARRLAERVSASTQSKHSLQDLLAAVERIAEKLHLLRSSLTGDDRSAAATTANRSKKVHPLHARGSAAHDMVPLTVYIDADVDERLSVEASAKRMSTAELFRMCLSMGMKSSGAADGTSRLAPAQLTAASQDGQPLVLRTIRIDSRIELKLRVEAHDTCTPRNDLVRRYVRAGISALHAPGVGEGK